MEALPAPLRDWVQAHAIDREGELLRFRVRKRGPARDGGAGGIFVTMECRMHCGRRVGVVTALPLESTGGTGPVADAGVVRGDAVLEINGRSLSNTPLLDLARDIRVAETGAAFELLLLRLPSAERRFDLQAMASEDESAQYRTNLAAQDERQRMAAEIAAKTAADRAAAARKASQQRAMEVRQEAKLREETERRRLMGLPPPEARASLGGCSGGGGGRGGGGGTTVARGGAIKLRALAHLRRLLTRLEKEANQVPVTCTACAGDVAEVRWMGSHPLLGVTVCTGCLFHYNFGTFEVGEDGNENFCRWCGDGGDVLMCDTCVKSFCQGCVGRNFGEQALHEIVHLADDAEWQCPSCKPATLQALQQQHEADKAELLRRKSKAAARAAEKAAEAAALARLGDMYTDEDGQRVHRDIARGQEAHPIPCVNGVDDDPFPLQFHYVRECVESASVRLCRDPSFAVCCDCEDNCRDRAKCACARLNGEVVVAAAAAVAPAAGGQQKGGSGGFAKAPPPQQQQVDGFWPYNRSKKLLGPQVAVYECHAGCRCHIDMCANRLVGVGITLPLEVFKTSQKGWGVRCRELVPAGSFLCCYAGELLSEEAAERRQDDDDYLFNLDIWSTNLGLQRLAAAGLKEGYEENVVLPPDCPPLGDQRERQQQQGGGGDGGGADGAEDPEQQQEVAAAATAAAGRGTGRPAAALQAPAAAAATSTSAASSTQAPLAIVSGGPEVVHAPPPSKRQKLAKAASVQDIMDKAEIEAESRGEMLCIDAKKCVSSLGMAATAAAAAAVVARVH